MSTSARARRALSGVALVLGCQAAPTLAVPHVAVAPSPSASASPSMSTPPVASSASVEPPASVASLASSAAPEPSAEPPEPKGPVCQPQAAFEFLMRKNYAPVKYKKAEHDKSLEWRTRHYGWVKGFGDKSWNSTKPKDHAASITLFGLPVTVHEKIVPALRCAEAEIAKSCGGTPYTPKTLSGMRNKNTYKGGEVTNHLYGIAVDLDPLLNSCCGCTKKWKASPLCKIKGEIWERMSMPKCWVDAFEKYGFYWLGHDTLQDTMHFEFLADPDAIMSKP